MQTETEKLDTLADRTGSVLFHAKTVFPFEFFPTEITIEKTKVDVKYGIFFGASRMKSILIEDILNVQVDTSVFFATLKMTTRLPSEPSTFIRYLTKQTAIKAQRIILGLLIGMHENIDLSKISVAELQRNAERLGRQGNSFAM